MLQTAISLMPQSLLVQSIRGVASKRLHLELESLERFRTFQINCNGIFTLYVSWFVCCFPNSIQANTGIMP